MRKKPLLSLTLILTLLSCGKGNPAVKEIVVNRNAEADLGTIKEKHGPVKALLLVPDACNDTLFPLVARTECSCMSAEVERKRLLPGDTLKVSVVYNPSYRKGIIMEEVAVICDNMPGYLSYIVKGEVIPMKHPVSEDCPYSFGNGIYLSHEVLNFGKLSPGRQARMFIRCANARRREAEVTFGLNHQDTSVRCGRSLHLSHNAKDTLWFSFIMPESVRPSDTLVFPLAVKVNGRDLPKKLTVKAVCRE